MTIDNNTATQQTIVAHEAAHVIEQAKIARRRGGKFIVVNDKKFLVP